MFKLRFTAGQRHELRGTIPTMLSAAADPWMKLAGVFFALQLPAWLVIGLWLWRRQENAHIQQDSGQCDRCGYSLTGNESGVCPECGTSALRRLRR